VTPGGPAARPEPDRFLRVSQFSPSPPPHFRGRYFTDLVTRSAYSEGAGPYRIVPDAVALPTDVHDVACLMRYATDAGVSLVPRAAGSGMPGNNVGRGIVVDLQAFNRPLFVSANRSANVGAAISYGELTRAAAQLHLRLPPDPSSGAFCTLGGMVSTNAAGARSLKFGSVRRWVRGVEFVTADGEVGWLGRSTGNRNARTPRHQQQPNLSGPLTALQRFDASAHPLITKQADIIRARTPATPKNSAGYALKEYLDSDDVVDLIIGAEGTLGIVTRVDVALTTKPAARSTVLLALRDVEELPDVVARLDALDPSACEMMDRTLLQVSRPPGIVLEGVDAILLVEFERVKEAGARGAAGDAIRTTEPWCVYARSGITEKECEELWGLRHAASASLARLPPTRRSLQVIEDGCVPPEKLGAYITGVRAAAAGEGIEIVAFGHAGDGHLHVNTLIDTTDPDFVRRLNALLTATTDLVADLGGTPSGEHGDGRLRPSTHGWILGPEMAALFAAVKQAFDPRGILNPGVVVPQDPSAPPLDHLKVGSDAEPIPDAVARRLADMERERGWSRSKLALADEVREENGITGAAEATR
jgi:FAD/FMN-containing dehydrogenase